MLSMRVIELSEALLLHQVEGESGLPRRAIWALVRRREFPMPGLIGSKLGWLPCWRRDEIEKWRQSREHA